MGVLPLYLDILWLHLTVTWSAFKQDMYNVQYMPATIYILQNMYLKYRCMF